jgi:ketosteroid isomerase-like protein
MDTTGVSDHVSAFVRNWIQAWNDEGVDGIEPFLADDVEWTDPPELPDATTHHGRVTTMEVLRTWEGASGGIRLKFALEEILSAGEEYVIVSVAEGAGGASGAPIPPHRWFHLVRFDDNGMLVKSARLFLAREQAVEAAITEPTVGTTDSRVPKLHAKGTS